MYSMTNNTNQHCTDYRILVTDVEEIIIVLNSVNFVRLSVKNMESKVILLCLQEQ